MTLLHTKNPNNHLPPSRFPDQAISPTKMAAQGHIDLANTLINQLLHSNQEIPDAVAKAAQDLENCLAEIAEKAEDAVLEAKRKDLLVKLCAEAEYAVWSLPGVGKPAFEELNYEEGLEEIEKFYK